VYGGTRHDAGTKQLTLQQGNIVTMMKKKKNEDTVWNDMFERLKQYKRKHGDCLVPQRFPEDPSLGCWVNFQRTRFKRGTIREDRKLRLEKLGFAWIKDDRCKWKADRDTSSIDFRWNRMYQELVNFREQTGHCMVPYSHRFLYPWVGQQRAGFREGWIREDRKTLLENIGFVWSTDPSDTTSSRVQRQWDGDQEEYNNGDMENIVLTSDLAAVEVGSRVAVYWPDDDQYYEATVTRERNKKLPLYLEYDDGDHEWIDLRQHRFRLLSGGTRRRWDEDDISDDDESDVDLGSEAHEDPDLDDNDNETNESELGIASYLVRAAEANSREISDGRGISDGPQRVVASMALVAKAAMASSDDSPKYPVGTKVKKVCIAPKNS
jgi:Helicase associated domain